MTRCGILTPLGPMCLEADGGALTRFFPGKCPSCDDTPLLLEAQAQLREYFSGQRREFDLPLAPVGTAFQEKVWAALCTIPCGETRSYGQIAAQLGNPKACRAVGMAAHRNPLPVFVPCHRVIGADGSLTGFALGTQAKALLLALEQNRIT